MDKEQGELLANLATAPRLAIPHYASERFDYWKNHPNELERRIPCVKGSSKFVDQLIIEARIDRMAELIKEDRERLNRWLEKYEEYKGRYPSNGKSPKLD